MGYTRQALKGFTWVWALRFLTRGFSFVRIAIIARVLTPNLFGLYGIAALVLSFVEVFTESGINIFIIQEKENLKKIVNTAWVVSIIRGLLIFLIIFLTAPLVAGFFDNQNVVCLIYLISIVPLIRGFINPSIIKFQKDLDFRSEFLFRGIIFIVESLSSILFVIILKDPSGIIYGMILGAMLEVVITFLFVKPVPRLSIEKPQVMRILSRGKWITAGGIFNYLFHNADDAVVGRVLGTASLGIYDAAYKISMLPITEVGETISKVIFPVYTQISEDRVRLRRAFLRTLIGITTFTFPIGIVFFFFAEPLVLLVLGEQWVAAIPIVQALAIFGVIKTYQKAIFSVYLSVKKQKYNTIVMFVSFLGMITSIIPLINSYGLVGAAYSVVFGLLLSLPLAIYYLKVIFR